MYKIVKRVRLLLDFNPGRLVFKTVKVFFQYSNCSQTCIKQHCIKWSVVKVLKFISRNYGNFHLFEAVIVMQPDKYENATLGAKMFLIPIDSNNNVMVYS